MTLEDRCKIADLYTEYGALLTKKQADMLQMYCELDLSLTEVAEQFGVSRQAVRDSIMHAVASLEHYEKVLRNVEKKEQISKLLYMSSRESCEETVAKIVALLED